MADRRCMTCGRATAFAGLCAKCHAEGHSYRLMTRDEMRNSLSRWAPDGATVRRRTEILARWDDIPEETGIVRLAVVVRLPGAS